MLETSNNKMQARNESFDFICKGLWVTGGQIVISLNNPEVYLAKRFGGRLSYNFPEVDARSFHGEMDCLYT